MNSDVFIRTYHVKHRLNNIKTLLEKAKCVADYAVANKKKKELLTSKYVKHYGLPSSISNQILRKYGKDKINKVSNINLIVPNQITKTKSKTDKNIISKIYNSIIFKDGIVTLKPLKISFRWEPGKPFEKINQVEISENKFMISVTFKKTIVNQEYNNVLGIDLNCGLGRHIANACDCKSGKVLNLGKSGPNIRYKYFKKRKKQKIKGDKEKRILKDLDHKISRKIVDYALKNKLKIIMEDLKGIRSGSKKGKGSKAGNRFVNSWSFYRLQTFIEYKAMEHGIPFIKVKPHYTSQECCCCNVIGTRDKETFICKNKKCKKFNLKRHADVNAGFNIGKRYFETTFSGSAS